MNSNFYYKFPKPQYLGAKYNHLDWIGRYLPNNIYSVLDAFSGSQSVSYFFKQLNLEVHTNDFLKFNYCIGKSLIENGNEKLLQDDIKILFSENNNPEYYNLMGNLFKDIFFSKEECLFLDAFRSNIEFLDKIKQSIALTIMNRALTRKVTMGHFAHTKSIEYALNKDRVKRNRSLIRPIKDIFCDLITGYNNCIFDNKKKNKSYCEDAISITSKLKNKVDLLYLDPPYCGSHADYQSFYHLLETFTQYWKDKQFVNSVNRYSPKYYSGFDQRKDIIKNFEELFSQARNIPFWLISYNDRSYPSKSELLSLIKLYKNVEIKEKEYRNSVGGKGSVKGSREILFFCF